MFCLWFCYFVGFSLVGYLAVYIFIYVGAAATCLAAAIEKQKRSFLKHKIVHLVMAN
jgi:hypothetical protein